MKKLITCALVGLFCLGTTAGFAQTKNETTQEKILRFFVSRKRRRRGRQKTAPADLKAGAHSCIIVFQSLCSDEKPERLRLRFRLCLLGAAPKGGYL